MPQSAKLAMVAATAGARRADVYFVWGFLLDRASRAEDRGDVSGWELATIAFAGELEPSCVVRIITEFERRKMLVDGRIAEWDAKQPIDKTHAERQKRYRQKQKNRDVSDGVTRHSPSRDAEEIVVVSSNPLQQELLTAAERDASLPVTPVTPVTPISVEYPLTTAAVHQIDPAVNGSFMMRLTNTVAQELLSDARITPQRAQKAVTDEWMAKAVAESWAKWNGRGRHGAGLLLSRVPQILKTWCTEP